MAAYTPQIGDIAACWGNDFQSRFITFITGRTCAPRGLKLGPSHVAIIAPYYGESDLYWYESTTRCDRKCLVNREFVSGVQMHEIHERAGDYINNNGRVVIYRLNNFESQISGADLATIQEALIEDYLLENIRYDMRGALLSGLRVTNRALSLLGVHRKNLFCSDMIASVLMRVELIPLDDPDRYTPAGLLRYLINEGVYHRHLEITEETTI